MPQMGLKPSSEYCIWHPHSAIQKKYRITKCALQKPQLKAIKKYKLYYCSLFYLKKSFILLFVK